MKSTLFALLLVSFATLGLGAPGARAQFAIGSLEFGPTLGAGIGFTHNQDAKNICPGLKAEEVSFLTCGSSSNAFKGYVSGSLDFTSKNRWPGLGVGLVLNQEWNRSLTTHVTFSSGEVVDVAQGYRQFGVGVNIYLPIPGTKQRLFLVPSFQQAFVTNSINISEAFPFEVPSTFRAALNGKAIQYGATARVRVAHHIYLEGGVSYEGLPALASDIFGFSGITGSANLWDTAFGIRYVFWGQ